MIEQTGFPKKLRLIKAAEYKQVFNNPKKKTDRYFTLLSINNGLNHPRLGLAIAKKNIKLAVARNKIKRAVRESFRLNQHELGSIDIVVLARRNAANVSSKKLTLSLQMHWKKLIL